MASKEDKIMIKILRQEKKKSYGKKRLLAQFSNKHLPLTKCEASAAEDL